MNLMQLAARFGRFQFGTDHVTGQHRVVLPALSMEGVNEPDAVGVGPTIEAATAHAVAVRNGVRPRPGGTWRDGIVGFNCVP